MVRQNLEVVKWAVSGILAILLVLVAVGMAIMINTSFVSAIQSFPQNSIADLTHPVRFEGGITSGITCNITISYPNNTLLVDFKSMTDNGDYFNYTLNSTQTSVKGTYDYDVTCIRGGFNRTDSFQYFINAGGIEPTEERTATLSRSIFIFLGLGVLCFIAMFFVRALPLKVTLFLLMVWFILMGINISFVSIQDEVINPKIENFMSFFTAVSIRANTWILYVLIVFWIITILVNILTLKQRRKEQRYQ